MVQDGIYGSCNANTFGNVAFGDSCDCEVNGSNSEGVAVVIPKEQKLATKRHKTHEEFLDIFVPFCG